MAHPFTKTLVQGSVLSLIKLNQHLLHGLVIGLLLQDVVLDLVHLLSLNFGLHLLLLSHLSFPLSEALVHDHLLSAAFLLEDRVKCLQLQECLLTEVLNVLLRVVSTLLLQLATSIKKLLSDAHLMILHHILLLALTS